MKKKQLLILDLVLAALALAAWPVSGLMVRFLPPCPFPAMGFLCPACGGTRCVRYLLRGQLGAALESNAFFLVLIFFVVAALALLNAGVLLNKPAWEHLARRLLSWRTVIVAAAVFAIFGILRNFV